MDFWLTDDQVALQEGIRSFLDGRFDLETTAAREAADAVIDVEGWRELADMGVFSLLSDGLDMRAAAIVFEELGRSLVPGPLVSTFVAADLIDGADVGDRIVGLFEPQGDSAIVEHEATTSKISDDQLFYCRQRGLAEEDAVNMIVNGFCKAVFRELPMEFAVEAQALLNVSLEGAVG